MITDNNLLTVEPGHFGGIQRIYRFNNNFGLSALNACVLQRYIFAWEIAVIKNVSDNGLLFDVTFDTPLTKTFEVFATDKLADAFIEKARAYFNK